MENNDIIKAKAEIERLKEHESIIEKMFCDAWDRIAELDKLNETAKIEAIKEFAERVKEKTLAMIWSPELFSTVDYIECIDLIVKETVGEQ